MSKSFFFVSETDTFDGAPFGHLYAKMDSGIGKTFRLATIVRQPIMMLRIFL